MGDMSARDDALSEALLSADALMSLSPSELERAVEAQIAEQDDIIRRRLGDAKTRAEFEDARMRRWLAWTLLLVRKQRGLTQKELATRTGTQQSVISDIEQGQVDFRLSTIQRIARALGISLELHVRSDSWTSLHYWTKRSWPYDSSVQQARVIETPDVEELCAGLPPRQRALGGVPQPRSVVSPLVLGPGDDRYLTGDDLMEMTISRVSSASAEVSSGD